MGKDCLANQMMQIAFYSLGRHKMFPEREWIIFLRLFSLHKEGIQGSSPQSKLPAVFSLPQLEADFVLQQET